MVDECTPNVKAIEPILQEAVCLICRSHIDRYTDFLQINEYQQQTLLCFQSIPILGLLFTGFAIDAMLKNIEILF